MKIACIVGARPNFMKIGPVIDALRQHPGLEAVLIHTGQHYDASMSKIFFEDLGLPEPDEYLGIGSDSQARQTARIMMDFEAWATGNRPDYVLVVGDVNSTLACALVAAKLRIRLGHVEAGLRSGDRDMPEEINRLVTDAISDDLYTSCEDAAPNLIREGVDPERIHFVGNVMIDSLVRHRPRAEASPVLETLGLSPREYTLVTLHRPSNVDEPAVFRGIMEALTRLSTVKPVVFPVHPRTRSRLAEFGMAASPEDSRAFRLIEPVGYLDFLKLMDNASLLVTDSGGIQEETTFLGIPCLTVRLNTERPVTVTEGTNELVGIEADAIAEAGMRALTGKAKPGRIPALWDGQAGERIAGVLARIAEDTA